MKKMIAASLACCFALSPVFAAETQIPEIPVPDVRDQDAHKGENNVPVTLDVLRQNKPIVTFSVTVPTSLPLVMDLSGNVKTATNAQVKNNSTEDVVVTDVNITAAEGWTLAAYDSALKERPADAKELGMEINQCKTDTQNLLFDQEKFPTVKAKNMMPVTYNAILPRQKQAGSVGTVANSVFVIGWADPTVDIEDVSYFDGNDFIVCSTVRDFKADGVLFEAGGNGGGKGLVNNKLNKDGSPSFKLNEWHTQISNQITEEMLHSLYPMDGSGDPKAAKTVPLRLKSTENGYYNFDDGESFFPIDNQLFGNEGEIHNCGFTTMAHTGFYYYPGQTLTAGGDDDVWVFLNDTLAIDLGGKHSTTTETINIDDLISTGILSAKPGDYVRLSIFHAERQGTASALKIYTNVDFKKRN